MSLKSTIQEDVKTAMRSRETRRLATLRLLVAAIRQREIDERRDLADADVLAVIEKLVKQRRDSIEQFRAGGREDLAAAESEELQVLEGYRPPALAEDALVAAIASAIERAGAAGPGDMGRVMAILKAELAGRADLGQVSGRVKAALASN
ncbi:MAG: GatB/YqeY domain-containing protein [Pseudomonadota bacterium]|jgi:uncharacterized protein YqeY